MRYQRLGYGKGRYNVYDLTPLAVLNLLKTSKNIYSSRLDKPMEHITLDMVSDGVHIHVERPKLTYLATPGFEYSEVCIEKDAKY